MIKLAVVGNPIFHSLSPHIFHFLGKENKLEIHYNRISCENPRDAINFARDIGLDGFNVTSPFKKSILELIDKLDYQAINLNSSNTVIFNGQIIEGYNTDYFGVLRTIWDNNLVFNKKKVLIIGSGAAAQTAAFAVRNFNSLLFMWDRNQSKAEKVSSDLGISFITTAELIQKVDSFDFVISTIPPNSRIFQELIFSPNQTIFDTVYHHSFFEINQEKYGYQLIKGEKWLINQALLAFELFASQKGNYTNLEKFISESIISKPKAFVFVGFPGSGKSTLAKIISNNLKCNFIDLDNEIEKEVNSTIFEIFMKFGEKAFRYRETEILNRISGQIKENIFTILSVGGGIFENPENIELLKQIGIITWIYSPFEQCYSRIASLETRPLIRDEISARELYERRKLSYFVNSENVFINLKSPEESALRLQAEISRILG